MQDNSKETIQAIAEITLQEVQKCLGKQPYLSEEGGTAGVYQAKYQWIKMPGSTK